jgi:hypothetical protein
VQFTDTPFYFFFVNSRQPIHERKAAGAMNIQSIVNVKIMQANASKE